MLSSEKASNIVSLALLVFLLALSLSGDCLAQSVQHPTKQEIAPKTPNASATLITRRNLENYKGQNGIVSMKTLVLGGEFRVTTVVPFKGNVADYTQLEIAKPVSLVGKALSAEVANRQVAKIKSQFESKKIFDSVAVIDSYNPPLYDRRQKALQTDSDGKPHAADDSLEAPIGSADDMEALDRRRTRNQQELEQLSTRTLVTVIEVLDYEKGSRWKQALPLDLGKSILTVRLRYYDKMTGQEIGRQIISGQSDGSSLLGPLSPRDALSGVADGLVDQVTRRVAASVK
jgi:hypothetical protein